jgi:hypothetical protein
MAQTNVSVMVFYNEERVKNATSVEFQSDRKICIQMSTKSNFTHFKERISQKVQVNGVVSEILYRHSMRTPDGNSYFQEVANIDDKDVKYMFNIHEQFNLMTIELYVTFQSIHSSTPQLTSPHV